MYTLHNVKRSDTMLNGYLSQIVRQYIKSIKLVYNKSEYREGNTWEAIAIEFRDGLTQDQLIHAITALKADEYWGVQDLYHVFWFD